MRLAAIAVAVGLALLLARAARAAAIDPGTGLPDVDLPAAAPDDGGDPGDASALDGAWAGDPMTNRQVFLYALRAAEHNAADVSSGNAYFAFYGHTPDRPSLFSDLSDHPAETGEKVGVPLPEDWCRRLGYADGQCVSTAAGAYQINRPTWREFREWGGPRLEDFSPESQDELARRILEHDGVLPLVDAGRWHDAIAAASRRWASLPGSKAGQHVRSWEFVAQSITNALNAQA